jgi:alpha-L-rhamnosidase
MGGIFPDPEQPGFKNIVLRPNFIKDVKSFEARHNSPYGEIISKWSFKNKNRVTYEVSVPANSRATLYLPGTVKGERVIVLEPGKHVLNLALSI